MSFSEWREIKLGDLVEVSSSKRIYAKEYVDSGIPFYRSKEIIEKSKGNDVSTELYISKERFNELKNKFGAPSHGDILLTSVGTLGVPYIVRKEEFYFKDGNLTWIKHFKDNCHNKFIFYWLLSPDGVNQINTRCIGSTQKALTIDTLKKFEIKIPPFEEQKAITQILSTLDDKIEVNNQINKTLENMAQTIFKQWFVDFEFPNEGGEPYKSSGGEMVESELGMIPKGWEVVQFRDVFKFIKGKKPKIIEECEFEDSEKYLTIDVLNRNSVLFCSKEKVIEANSDDVLMVMDGASSGAIYFGQKGVVASTLAKLELTSKKVSNQFLFYMIKYFENDIKTHTTGSAIPHTDKEYTYRLMIALPNDISIQLKINDLLCGISDNFIAREQDNAVLKTTKDALLPKLMSGEIRVPLDEEGDVS